MLQYFLDDFLDFYKLDRESMKYGPSDLVFISKIFQKYTNLRDHL